MTAQKGQTSVSHCAACNLQTAASSAAAATASERPGLHEHACLIGSLRDHRAAAVRSRPYSTSTEQYCVNVLPLRPNYGSIRTRTLIPFISCKEWDLGGTRGIPAVYVCVSVRDLPLFRSQNSFLLSFLNVAFNQSQLGRRETCKPVPVPDEGRDGRMCGRTTATTNPRAEDPSSFRLPLRRRRRRTFR